ncbi:MAG TPA: hypothetical protein VM123_14335 [archaeon]|nr:hypothetical protein [archaeon]
MELSVISIFISILALIVSILSLRLGWKRFHILKNQELETKRKEMEIKRREVRELQPKLHVKAHPELQPTWSIRVEIINKGSEAKNIEITMDGSNSRVKHDELGVNFNPPRSIVPFPLHLNFSKHDDICQKPYEKPILHIKYHDKWFPETEYYISIPFKQKKVISADDYNYMPNFEDSKQDPPWEETAYSGYTDKQILEIWNRENLGRS